jgi:hypothetical protein
LFQHSKNGFSPPLRDIDDLAVHGELLLVGDVAQHLRSTSLSAALGPTSKTAAAGAAFDVFPTHWRFGRVDIDPDCDVWSGGVQESGV